MKSITAALISAKANFKSIHKNKVNPHFKNKYADLDSILESVSPALCEAGLLLTQPTKLLESGLTVLVTKITHAESGESIESELLITIPGDPQKLGAVMTYYRRFSLCSLLAIAPDDDDDGNTAKAASVKASVDLTDRVADLRKAFEVLNWDPTKKSDWIKTISSKPVGTWGEAEYDLAGKRAWKEVHESAKVI